MNSSDEREREVEALRERSSSLSGAVLRISASLDVGTVLRETVDSAGARYGAITTIDEAGRPQDFVTSDVTADEQRQLEAWPHAMRFFEHLRDLPGPLRLPDLPGYLRSLGYADVLALSRTLQATPMRHRGVHVGDFFLGEKEGGQEFTADDEEILVLFASQAANAIANARAHRDERRARADPRGPGGDLAGRRRGVRRRDRQAGVVEPGGEAARRRAERPQPPRPSGNPAP